MAINDGLSTDLRNKRYREIPVGEEFDRLVKPPSKTKHGVYHYSTAIDQGTQLHKEDFVNFGKTLTTPHTHTLYIFIETYISLFR